MYEKFFRLQRAPFRMAPDAECLHLTGQHADVISGAVFGILDRKGFVVLTGEAGLGKTSAILAVIDMLDESRAEVSVISHPTLNPEDFLELALLNFGVAVPTSSKAQRLKILENFLTLAHRDGKVCVLIVDEAHKLPPDALEEVRLLGNLQIGDQKLLQILLVGQNELNARLNLPELWQLKQRIAFRLVLKRLDREGVEQYIRFRWIKAGGTEIPFDDAALDGISKWSTGIPRVINAICDNALMLALSDSARVVSLEQVRVVCQDLQLATPAIAPRLAAQRFEERAAETPVLVKRAAAGAGTTTAGEPRPSDVRAEPWSAERPSLLKKWRGFLETQKPAAAPTRTKDSGPLSLKKHM